MDLNKYHKLVENLINLNVTIDSRWFNFTKFFDADIENKFIKDSEIKDKHQKILSDIILISGFIASLLYILFAFYQIPFLISCLSCFAISIILIVISYFVKSTKIKYMLNIIEILMISITFNIKANLLNYYYNSALEDNYAELVRVIIYDFVSVNLFVLLKLEANIFVNILFFSLNLYLIITSSIHSNVNRFYFLEGFTSFLLNLVFFLLRKAWDFKMRVIFAEKFKFQKLYKYTIDFIIGLNAFHLTIRNNEIIYSDQKLKKLLENISKDFEKFILIDDETEKLEKENISQKIQHMETNLNLLAKQANDRSNTCNQKLLRTDEQIDFQENNNLKYFLRNLFLYVDIDVKNTSSFIGGNFLDKNLAKNNCSVEKEVLIKIKNNKNYDINNNNSKYNKISSNSINISNSNNALSKIELLDNESLFIHLNKIRNFEISKNLYEKERLNDKENEMLKNNFNIEKDSCKINIKKKDNCNFIKENTNNNFIHLGIYHLKDSDIKCYFDVYYRGISIDESDTVYDILFYDVSELINSKKFIYQENIIKQKILAKIAHEFKTPINSIIGLINNLKDNIRDNDENEDFMNKINVNNMEENELVHFEFKNNDDKNTDNNNKKFDLNKIDDVKKKSSKNFSDNNINKLKILDIIQNLSKYIIFLVSDIIQFSTIKDINQININKEIISMREVANFSLEILNSLIRCNLSKSKNITTLLKYQDELDYTYIKIDEIRLKQIILNIISNAVKFTKCGFIKIKFRLVDDGEFIKISVSDSGIGIKDTDKDKLFNDNVMLGDGSYLNIQGSGLGLSICKSLAYKMNLKLNYESEYGVGTRFFIKIPIKKELNKSANNINPKLDLIHNKKEIEEIQDYRNLIKPASYSAREGQKSSTRKIESFFTKRKLSQNSHKNIEEKVNIEYNKTNKNFIDTKPIEDFIAFNKSENSYIKKEQPSETNDILIPNKSRSNIKIIDFENESKENNIERLDSSDTIITNFSQYNEKESLIDLENMNKNSSVNNDEFDDKYSFKDSKIVNESLITKKENILTSKEEKKLKYPSRRDSLKSSRMNFNFNSITINYNSNNPNLKFANYNNHNNEENLYLDLDNNHHHKLINKVNSNSRTNSNPTFFEINFKTNEEIQSNLEKELKLKTKKNSKILVVDDNQFINDNIKRLLEKIVDENRSDIEIVQATDGIDLIKSIIDDQENGNLIKCVLTDENMEYINGSEAIKMLRNLEKNNKIKHIKIISISSQEDNASVKMILDAGADLVLGKPISKNLIKNSLTYMKII